MKLKNTHTLGSSGLTEKWYVLNDIGLVVSEFYLPIIYAESMEEFEYITTTKSD